MFIKQNDFIVILGKSGQKGKIENNHEYIRRFVPKGESFDEYTQDDINLMINHINSVKRGFLMWSKSICSYERVFTTRNERYI